MHRSPVWLSIVLFPTAAAAQRMEPLPPLCSIDGRTTTPTAAIRAPATLAVVSLTLGPGGENVAYLADGLADAITERLAATAPSIELLDRRAKRRNTDGDAARRIAPESESKFIASGSVSNSREGTRVLMSLFDVKAGRRVWEKTYAYDSVGGWEIVRAASGEIANRVSGSAASREIERSSAGPKNRVAYDWILRGEAAVDAGAMDRGVLAFRNAVRLAPNFADAHAKLAIAAAALVEDGVEQLGSGTPLIKEIQASANRAIALDPRSSLAWLAEAEARALEGRSTGAWRAAFDRALALDRKNASVLERYGLALARSGDASAAKELLWQAAKQSRHRAPIFTALAEVSMTENADAEACDLLNRAITDDAMFGPAWAVRALVRARHGDLRFAWADAETATQVGYPLLGQSAAAIVDLKSRDTTHARTRLSDLWAEVEGRGTIGIRDGRAVALAFLAAGQVPRAIDVLERVRPRGTVYAAIAGNPMFDRARREPRFRDLLAPPKTGAPRTGAPTANRHVSGDRLAPDSVRVFVARRGV